MIEIGDTAQCKHCPEIITLVQMPYSTQRIGDVEVAWAHTRKSKLDRGQSYLLGCPRPHNSPIAEPVED